MIRLASRLFLFVALLATTACEEEMIALTEGTASSLTVNVYVDRDGDGVRSGADMSLNGATVTVSGPVELSAQVSGGVAEFSGLQPGTYQLALAGANAQGATLVTASNPVVVAPFQGAELTSEFRFSFFPGEIEGRVFRDDDDDGSFSADADLPAAGITIELFGSGGPEPGGGGAIATTTTDADGSYSFETLRPGGYFVRITPLESMTIEGSTLRNVVVDPEQTADASFIFEGTLLIDIADAREAPEGQVVTVRGIVIFAPGFNDALAFIQDETAGITVFGVDDFGVALERGDVIEVTGIRDEFFTEIQISDLISLEVTGTTAVPDPRPVTAIEINDGLFQGELATNEGVVETVDVLSFDNQLVTLRDAAGDLFNVFVDERTGVGPDTWSVGQTFAVTGVLGVDTRDDLPFRIEVRGPEDVQAGGAVIPISDARTMAGESVVVRAVVTWVSPDDAVIFFQDGTGGMSTFDFDLPELQRGDEVILRGTVGAFRGEVQLSPVDDVQILGNVPLPSPLGVTGAELNAGAGQGQLVVATGTVQSVDVLDFGNQMVILQDAAGTDFRVRVDSRTGVESDFWTVGETVRVTGVVGNDDRNDPAPQIEIRGADDVESMIAGTVSIAEARSMVGSTVTVRGVVSRKESWDDSDGFIQDGSGGVFVSGGLEGAEAGDRIEITGPVEQAFGNELEIVDGTVTVLGSPGLPAPIDASGARVFAGLFQGVLVRVTGTVIDVAIINEFGTQVVTIRTADGTELEAFSDNRTGLSESSWTLGETVTIVGPVGRFFDPQLEIMQASDVDFGS